MSTAQTLRAVADELDRRDKQHAWTVAFWYAAGRRDATDSPDRVHSNKFACWYRDRVAGRVDVAAAYRSYVALQAGLDAIDAALSETTAGDTTLEATP